MLTLDSVDFHFGPVQALQNISLTFEPGTVTAIVGDNGAGKSTLMKNISGLLRPSGGRIVVDGKDATDQNVRERRHAGIEMIYQDLALSPLHDVTTNLFLGNEKKRFGFWLDQKTMRREAQELLERLGINLPLVHHPVISLSGGQRQAVAILRALRNQPKILILDEPTSALAAGEIEKLLNLLQTLKARGMTILLVSHRLDDVFRISDQIVVLRRGTVVAHHPIQETNLQQVLGYITGAI